MAEEELLLEVRKMLQEVTGYDLIKFIAVEPKLLAAIEENWLERLPLLHETQKAVEFYPDLTGKPGFEEIVQMIDRTQNVNRSNISAVLSVASRRSEELKQLIEDMMVFFGNDMDSICAFFRSYFEQVQGWKLNKMNRKEGIRPEYNKTSKLWYQIVDKITKIEIHNEPALLQVAQLEDKP